MTTMMVRVNKTLFFIFLIFVLLGLTGCGNRVEINDRSIVLGVAIDKPLSPQEENSSGEQGSPQQETEQGETPETQKQKSGGFLRIKPPPPDQVPRYAMTVETPVIKQLGGTGEEGGGGGQKAGNKWVITSTGNTIWDIERALSIRIGRQNFFGHLKVIAISEEVAREGIEPVLDFFTRRREVQQNIKLAIVNGEARKVLQVTPLEENFASFYLDSMLEALFRTSAKINTNLLEIRRSLADTGNAVLPRIRASSPTEIIAGGAAVIKDWKFIGWLSEYETSGFNVVQARSLGGSVPIVDPKNKSGLLNTLFRSAKGVRSVKIVNGKPVYKIKIVSEWDIVEKQTSTLLWDTKYLKQVENLIALECQRRSLNVIDKMQREYKADVFEFGTMLARKYPDYWENVKDEWDKRYFPEAKISVEVSAKIRRTESKR